MKTNFSKWLLTLAALAVLVSQIACTKSDRRQQAERVNHQPDATLWIAAQITWSRDGFRSEGFPVASQLITINSGRKGVFDNGWFHWEIIPRDNGDHTITITSLFTDEADASPSKGQKQSAVVTVVNGQTVIHQLGPYRLTFAGSSDPKFFSEQKLEILASTFEEGAYGSYSFERGRFSLRDTPGLCAAGYKPQKTSGRYFVRGEELTLSFDGESPRIRTLKHLIIDRVHVLIDESKDFFVRVPPGINPDKWWNEMPVSHPTFASALPRETSKR